MTERCQKLLMDAGVFADTHPGGSEELELSCPRGKGRP